MDDDFGSDDDTIPASQIILSENSQNITNSDPHSLGDCTDDSTFELMSPKKDVTPCSDKASKEVTEDDQATSFSEGSAKERTKADCGVAPQALKPSGKEILVEKTNTTSKLSDSDTDFSEDEVEHHQSSSTGYSESPTIDVSKDMNLKCNGSPALSSIHSSSSSTSNACISKLRTVSYKEDAVQKSSGSEVLELMSCSQDMFFSQTSASSSQESHPPSTSQLIPTLQLSSEEPIRYEGFMPDRLLPSTPLAKDEDNSKASTSTPVTRKASPSPDSTNVKHAEIISLSDDEVSLKLSGKDSSGCVLEQGDKRKLSDCSEDSCRASVPFKRIRTGDAQSRQSVMVLEEIRKPSQISASSAGSQNAAQVDSQAFHLHFSSSPGDQDTTSSQDAVSSVSPGSSWKRDCSSTLGASSNEVKESSICDTASRDINYSSYHDISVVRVDDAEDDVQLISPKKHEVEEITLDSSEHRQRMSTSNDGIEVLSPPDTSNAKNLLKSLSCDRVKAGSFASNSPTLGNHRQRLDSSSFSLIPEKFKAKHSTPQRSELESPSGNLSSIHDLDNSKENLCPGKQANVVNYKNDFVLTFYKTYKITCQASINEQEKKLVNYSILSLEDGDAKTSVGEDQRRDPPTNESSSVPSQSSPGSVTSGGHFALPLNRMSMASATSSSSGNSSASSMFHRAGSSSSYDRFGNGFVSEAGNGTQGSANHQESQHWYREMIQWDNGLNSGYSTLLRSHVQHQWASTGSQLVGQWTSSLLKGGSLDGNNSNRERKIDTVQEDDNEEVVGVPSPALKMSARRARRKKPVAVNKVSNKGGSTPQSAGEKSLLQDQDHTSNVGTVQTPQSEKRKRGRPPKKTAEPTVTPADEGKRATTSASKARSKTKEKSTPVPSLDSTPGVPQESPAYVSDSFYQPGAPVFAAWGGFYYPAKLESLVRPNRWIVVFHDSKKKSLDVKFIRLGCVFEIGQPLLAKHSEADYGNGIVTEVTSCVGKDDLYTVQMAGGAKITVPWSDLCLTVEQAEQFRNDLPQSSSKSSSPNRTPGSKQPSDIDLANYIAQKRVRTPKQSVPCRAAASDSRVHTSARRCISDSETPTTGEEEGPLALMLVTGVDPEQIGFACADPLAKKAKVIKGAADELSLSEEDGKMLRDYGPIPEEGSKIFAGYIFLLTATDARPLAKSRVFKKNGSTGKSESDDQGARDHSSDSEHFAFTFRPFSKSRLRRQLEAGGGRVVTDFSEITLSKDLKNTYVVTHRPCLTAVYIECLARGVRSIGHDHIIACCIENKKIESGLRDHIMPPGHSVTKDDWARWAEHKTKAPLRGQKIFLCSENKNFRSFWGRIVELAGAEKSSNKSGEPKFATIVVSDGRCSEPTLDWASCLNIPVVSPTYITQCLINNEVVAHDFHPSFAHDKEEV